MPRSTCKNIDGILSVSTFFWENVINTGVSRASGRGRPNADGGMKSGGGIQNSTVPSRAPEGIRGTRRTPPGRIIVLLRADVDKKYIDKNMRCCNTLLPISGTPENRDNR